MIATLIDVPLRTYRAVSAGLRLTVSAAVSVSALLAVALPAHGQCQVARVTSDDNADSDHFADSQALSGDAAIFGAYRKDDLTGAAYVFRRGPAGWLQEAKLVPADAEVGDWIGRAVVLRGETAVIGAPYDDDMGDAAGAAYVYRYDGASWIEEAKLTPEDPAADGHFGLSMTIRDDLLAISASDGVYLFREQAGAWVETAKLTVSGVIGTDFGRSIALDSEAILIGAPYFGQGGANYAGTAYVFRLVGDLWTEEAQLLAPDAGSYHFFGHSTALVGDLALVGSNGGDPDNSGSGAVYVFRRDDGVWTEAPRLVAPDTGARGFGRPVTWANDRLYTSVSDDTIYEFRNEGDDWLVERTLHPTPFHRSDGFGSEIAVEGGVVLCGAYQDSENGSWSGAAYVFDFDDPVGPDCNDNGLCDAGEINDGTLPDCNVNAVPDACDIASGASLDCDENGVPDECDPDCNGNGIADACDIADGSSPDCNEDGIPDECDIDYRLDDGTIEAVVLGGGIGIGWLNAFEVAPGEETVIAVGVTWAQGWPAGEPASILVYADPNDDGDPTDAVLLWSDVIDSQEVSSGEIVVVPIDPTYVGEAGERFFVGMAMENWLMPMDTGSRARLASWIVGSSSGVLDLDDLGNNGQPPALIHEICCAGNWPIRAYTSVGGVSCGDIDGDGDVDFIDLVTLLGQWGECPEPPAVCPADLDGNLVVDFRDLLVLLFNWG